VEKIASIISVGNEILKGRTVNTNFAHIGRILTFAGYRVQRGYVCEDTPESISETFREAVKHSEIVVSSGGLGPTFDDITVDSVARAFSLKMMKNDHIATLLRNHYSSLNLPLTPEREKMAYLPEGANYIENPVGIAPGVVVNIGTCRIILLPGVPHEMEALMGLAKDQYLYGGVYCEKSVIIENMMESTIAPLITAIMKKHDGAVYIKTHPLNSENILPKIEVEVSSYGSERIDCAELVKTTISEILNAAESLKGRHDNATTL